MAADNDVISYNRRRGEFSIWSDIAFDLHLKKMYYNFKIQNKLEYPNYWYKHKISFFDTRDS